METWTLGRATTDKTVGPWAVINGEKELRAVCGEPWPWELVEVVRLDALQAEREKRERAEARLSDDPPRTKVRCPQCGRRLGDVVDALVRQRGKFKSQREQERKRAEQVERRLDEAVKALEAIVRREPVPLTKQHDEAVVIARDALASIEAQPERGAEGEAPSTERS